MKTLIYLITSLALAGATLEFPDEDNKRPVTTKKNVITTQVAARALSTDLDLMHGIVKPEREVAIRTSKEGILMALKVAEGDRVKAGQSLARLDDRVARASVRAAEATAHREGLIDAARADLAVAESMMSRLERTSKAGATTPADLEEAVARRDKARANLKSTGEEILKAERMLDLERERLALHEMTAPFEGRIVRVHAKKGATMTPDSDFLQLVDLRRLIAEIHLPSSLYHELNKGGAYRLLAGSPVSKEIQGTLTFIDPMLDPTTGTFRAVFSIANEAEELPSGFTIRLVTEKKSR